MHLSAPIRRLRSNAKLLARQLRMPLHEALDRVAAAEGFRSWSLLVAKASGIDAAASIHAGLRPGDLLLLGARPGQGKTLMALRLAVQAARTGATGLFFTLEYTQADLAERFRAIGVDPRSLGDRFVFHDSEAICADFIAHAMAGAPPRSLAVVDYLQLLDQKRDKPPLDTQIRALKSFARETGAIIAFVSQIDRAFTRGARTMPDASDIRLPNPLDLALFDRTCFLANGAVSFS